MTFKHIPTTASRWYISGPISTVPDGNRAAFKAAAEWLTANGMDAIDPCEMDSSEEFSTALADKYGDTYWHLLARDVQIVPTVHGIVLLRDWQKSLGARLEVFIGLATKKRFAEWYPSRREALTVPSDYIRDELRRNLP